VKFLKQIEVKTKKGDATKTIAVLVFVAVFAELQQGEDPSTPDYDSGWVGISEKLGQYITLTHNLGTTEAIMNISGKIIFDGEAHHKFLGLGVIGSPVGFNESYGGTMYDNAQCVIATSNGGFAIAGFTESFGAGGYDFWIIKTNSAGNLQWNQTYGGAENEYAYSLVETSDGGFAMVGYKYSDYWSNHDVWLVKTDSYGFEQWNQTIDQTNWDDAYSLVETSNGGFAIAGNTADSEGMDDFWLIKTDSNGVEQWNQTYGRYNHDSGRSVVETSDGGFAIAGTVGPTEFGAGEHDFWLTKTDAYGNEQWSHTYGGTGEDEAYSVVETSDGGFAITGRTDSYGILNSNFWLVKTDAYGNMLWSQTWGGVNSDYALSVVKTSDGGYAITGYTNLGGNYDVYLIKTDAAGAMQWSQTFGGAGYDYGQSLVQTADGGYAIAGYTNSAGNYDVYLIKTDAAGAMQWSQTFGGAGSDVGYEVVQTSGGGYAIIGYTNSFGAGLSDAYLIKTGVEGEFGLARVGSTSNTLTLYRGLNDVYWNYVRARIWKID
jgi:hypothetical protein